MKITGYQDIYRDDIISLILSIQNDENGLGLSLEEQPDLLDIRSAYEKNGGRFWVAEENGQVIGTIALMMKEKHCAVLKKFFVKAEYRSRRIGLALYETLLSYAVSEGVRHIILDTPSVAKASHRFYERAGFRRISRSELPVPYDFPDRNSYIYLLDIY